MASQKLKYRFRKKQFYKPRTGPFYYTLSGNIAVHTSGVDPDPRTSWYTPNDEDILGDKLELWYSLRENDEPDTRGNNYETNASNDIVITGDLALWFIDLLENDPLNAVNVIDVEVYDVRAEAYYPIMQVNKDTYRFHNVDQGGCYRTIKLKEQEARWDCFSQISVYNNHQGWFDPEVNPVAPTEPQLQAGDPPYHPRMGYCNEVRPTLWVRILLPIYTVIGMFIDGINGLITAINFITGIINTILSYIGLSNISIGAITPVEWNGDDNLVGCGRVHHAPKIRHLLKNVCDYCELDYDDDIFNTTDIHELFSDEIPTSWGSFTNPYEKALFYAPIYHRGYKAHKHLGKFFDSSNIPILTGYDLIEYLRKPFNLKWKIRNGIFKVRNKHFYGLTYVFDFSDPNETPILNTPEFQWDQDKYPAFIEGASNPNDEKDNLSNEVAQWYNHVIDNNKINSPQMKGKIDVTGQNIAPTAFMWDGRRNQYITDLWFEGVGLAISNGILTSDLMDDIRGFIVHKDDTVAIPRVVIFGRYDDLVNRKAKALNYQTIESNYVFGFGLAESLVGTQYIEPNIPLYAASFAEYDGPTAFTPADEYWKMEHMDGTQNSDDLAPGVGGKWVVPNYPMMFDPRYKFNLATFHKLDQARFGLRQKLETIIEVQLCAENLVKLKAFRIGTTEVTVQYNLGNAYYNDIQIDEMVILPTGQTPSIQAYTGYDLSNTFRIMDIKIQYERDVIQFYLKTI